MNDGMGRYVAREAARLLLQAGKSVCGSGLRILGITYKEDVRDARNLCVFDLIRELEGYGCEVFVYDPLVPKVNPDCPGLAFAENPFENHSRRGCGGVSSSPSSVSERGLRTCFFLLNPA